MAILLHEFWIVFQDLVVSTAIIRATPLVCLDDAGYFFLGEIHYYIYRVIENFKWTRWTQSHS